MACHLSLVVEAEDKACQHLSLVEEEGEDVAELAWQMVSVKLDSEPKLGE